MPISPWKSALLYLGLAVLGPWASALAGGDAAAVPGPVFETLRVDADSLRITLELPMTALAPIGVLHFRDSADPKHAVVNADSLAAYLKLRMILIQDDGMLVPVIRQITTPKGDPPI